MTTESDVRPFTVVVGVSESSKSPVALAWAVDQAKHHNGRVIAVRAHRISATGTSRAPTLSRDESTESRDALIELQADVSEVLGEEAAIVECRVDHSSRLATLVKESENADLLVIDAPRPTNLLAGPLFAHRVVYRAECPVVVMPPGVSQEPSTWLERLGRSFGRNALRAAGTAGRPGMSGLAHPQHPEE